MNGKWDFKIQYWYKLHFLKNVDSALPTTKNVSDDNELTYNKEEMQRTHPFTVWHKWDRSFIRFCDLFWFLA